MKLIEKLFGTRHAPAMASLSIEEGKESSALFVDVGALTDKGRVRDHNEDSIFVMSAVLSQEEDLLPTGLYIVADGMGGHEGGDQASALAVRLVASWVLDKIYHPLLSGTGANATPQPISQVLTEALVVANGHVHKACPQGGTTLTCAFVLGSNAYLAHVGDSRAYVIHRSTLRRITTDHSLVTRLIELGQITPEDARTHPQRSVLYRALGRAGSLEVDTYLQALPPGSSLLLCSDGLWGVVPEDTALAIVRSAPNPQAACRSLIARANENGGEDNVTAILVQMKG